MNPGKDWCEMSIIVADVEIIFMKHYKCSQQMFDPKDGQINKVQSDIPFFNSRTVTP